MSVSIPIVGGLTALVDPEDVAKVSAYRWRPSKKDNLTYARTRSSLMDGRKTLLMHRVILNAPAGSVVDHIDGNGLNNCKSNLRFATASQNCANSRLRSSNTSGFKGVHFNKQAGKWQAQIRHNYKVIYLGRFSAKEDAARAYDNAAQEIFGAFAKTNF